MRKKLLVLLGPTSSGKTDLGLSLAKKYNGELIACDSRQVYKGLDIGTGKLPGRKVITLKKAGHWVFDEIPVWMIDVVDPKKQYSLWEYIHEASLVIKEITSRGKLPILIGGTALYLKALIEGLTINVSQDEKLRASLEQMSLEEIQQKLADSSLQIWQGLNESERKNKRRLIRKIEIALADVEKQQSFAGLNREYEVLKIGLTTNKETLNKRIDERVVKRVNEGLLKEGKKLHAEGLSLDRMKRLGLEYGVIALYLEGTLKSIDEFIGILQKNIHQYAKRQMTFFIKDKSIHWFDLTDPDFITQLEKQVSDWYNTSS